jgi:hypothetical protein
LRVVWADGAVLPVTSCFVCIVFDQKSEEEERTAAVRRISSFIVNIIIVIIVVDYLPLLDSCL